MCVDADRLTDEQIQKEQECDETGIESETKVLRFHSWLVTTMNEGLPGLSEDLKQKENEKKELVKQLKMIHHPCGLAVK